MQIQEKNQALSVDAAIARSQDYLLSMQQPDGYWWAELESNVTITAEMVLLHKIWGTDLTRPLHKVDAYLRSQQRAHGGWELFYGDGGDLNTSVEAYTALRLLGVPATDPAGLEAAERWILERQEATGDWGGIIPAMLNSLLALRCLDYDAADPVVARGLRAIDRFAIETPDSYRV